MEAVGQVIAPVRAYCQMGLSVQQFPLALNGQAAAKLALSTAVANQPIALDAHGVLGLGLFDRNIAGDIGWIAQTIVAIAIRAPAPGPR